MPDLLPTAADLLAAAEEIIEAEQQQISEDNLEKARQKLWEANAGLAKAAAEQHNGIIISSTSSQTSHLPFAALVLSATDDVETFRVAADIGCYLAAERNVKERPICELTEATKPGVLGVFTMVANPKLGRLASDAHWRDNHAPLALQIHEAMTHYYQLSIQHRFHGPNWQGFALCCFASEDSC